MTAVARNLFNCVSDCAPVRVACTMISKVAKVVLYPFKALAALYSSWRTPPQTQDRKDLGVLSQDSAQPLLAAAGSVDMEDKEDQIAKVKELVRACVGNLHEQNLVYNFFNNLPVVDDKDTVGKQKRIQLLGEALCTAWELRLDIVDKIIGDYIGDYDETFQIKQSLDALIDVRNLAQISFDEFIDYDYCPHARVCKFFTQEAMITKSQQMEWLRGTFVMWIKHEN